MKKLITYLLMFSFVITYAQFEQGTIHLKDGSVKKGLIKKRDLGGIKYKENEESEIELHDFNDIIGFDITEKGIVKYRYKKVGNNNPQIMQIVRLGKINLYSIKVASRDITTGIRTHYNFLYFIEKNNITRRVGKKLSKADLELFNDCPNLIKKIKKKEFKKNDIYKIVNFYDMNCN